METTLKTLRAIAESSRLRLLALLETGEVSVGELVIALEQSQPRVSRHLKLLVDAGLVENFRDSHHVYYRLSHDSGAQGLLREVLRGLIGNAEIAADLERLAKVRQAREKDAYSRIDTKHAWAQAFRQSASVGAAEEALDDALSDIELGELLSVRTDSGRLLQHLAPQARSATGVEHSQAMRLLARSRLQQAGLAECTVRNAAGNQLPFAACSFDTVLLNEALSRATDKRQVLSEAARVLRSGGRLLVLDWVQQAILQNKDLSRKPEQGAALMADNQLRTLLAEQGLSVVRRSWLPGKSPNYALFMAIPVSALKIDSA
ncbi:MAG: metalloregulator ArsR/SmtB family transcription factor [Gammaproteobacteria bacterium]|nr:metalloregulator ArsR/SmtB family transcription factor [Gammaproteobacteria bacterium]